jgi:hypothetical protein
MKIGNTLEYKDLNFSHSKAYFQSYVIKTGLQINVPHTFKTYKSLSFKQDDDSQKFIC